MTNRNPIHEQRAAAEQARRQREHLDALDFRAQMDGQAFPLWVDRAETLLQSGQDVVQVLDALCSGELLDAAGVCGRIDATARASENLHASGMLSPSRLRDLNDALELLDDTFELHQRTRHDLDAVQRIRVQRARSLGVALPELLPDTGE